MVHSYLLRIRRFIPVWSFMVLRERIHECGGNESQLNVSIIPPITSGPVENTLAVYPDPARCAADTARSWEALLRSIVLRAPLRLLCCEELAESDRLNQPRGVRCEPPGLKG